MIHTSYYISTFVWSKRSIATVVAYGVSRACRKSVSLPLYWVYSVSNMCWRYVCVLTFFTLYVYTLVLLSTEAESGRTVIREAGAVALGHMTKASLSAPGANQSPGYGDALVHGSNTIREHEPVQAAVLISAVSAGASGQDRSSSTSASPGESGLGSAPRTRDKGRMNMC